MRTARVFYLFLSVLQFIFFLKLVEYVRGSEMQSMKNSSEIFLTKDSPVARKDENVRGLFIAPNIKRKKLRSWKYGKSSNSSQVDSSNTESSKLEEILLNNSSQNIFQSKRDQYEKEVARLCPACNNNECVSVKPISAGFPIVPVIIAVITGIAWFILFLIFWIFFTRPKGHESGGYEGGYGSPQSEYGADSEKSSIFDHFLKPNERSLKPYTQLIYHVLDSIEKISDMYNS